MGYPIYHSQYTAAQIEAAIGKGPRVNQSGFWEVWNVSTGAYESTGVGAGVTPPTVVSQVSQMTNHGYIYIYNGSETGYTAGYWYYWDGSAWTVGGAYQVAATDTTLTVAGAAADSKSTGDAVDKLKIALTNITGVTEVTGWSENHKFIKVNGAICDINSVKTTTEDVHYVILTASYGDRFTITATGGLSSRAYAFLESDGTVIERSTINENLLNRVVTAPFGTAHLVINDNSDPVHASYIGVLQEAKIRDINNELNVHKYNIVWEQGSFDSVTGKKNPANNRCRIKEIFVRKGFNIYVQGNGFDHITGFYGENGYTPAESSWTSGDISFTVEEDGYFYLQVKKQTSNDDFLPSDVRTEIMVSLDVINYSDNVTYLNAAKRLIGNVGDLLTPGYIVSSSNGNVLERSFGSCTLDEITNINVVVSNTSYDETGILCYIYEYDENGNMLFRYQIDKGDCYVRSRFASFIRISFNYPQTSGLSMTQDIIRSMCKLYSLAISVWNYADKLRDIPITTAVEMGYKKSQQFIEIKWLPIHDYPKRSSTGVFGANVEVKGIPYSSTEEISKAIGYDVTLETFMTALHNPYSLLYTENINESYSKSAYGFTYHGGNNSGAYYGTVCNQFSCLVNGYEVPFDSGEHERLADDGVYLEKVYDQSAQGVMLLDIIWETGHCFVVTDIIRSSRNEVLCVLISEENGTKAVNNSWRTADQFNSWINDKIIYRNKQMYKNCNYKPSPFVAVENEEPTSYIYNDDICTFYGDKACVMEGDLMVVHALNMNYPQMEIYKNDTLLETITLFSDSRVRMIHNSDVGITSGTADDGAYEVNLGVSLSHGMYKARLKNEDNYSEYTYWEVLDCSLSYDPITKKASFSTDDGSAVWWEWCTQDSAGLGYKSVPFTKDEIESGEFDASDKGATYDDLKVHIQGKYGRAQKWISVS